MSNQNNREVTNRQSKKRSKWFFRIGIAVLLLVVLFELFVYAECNSILRDAACDGNTTLAYCMMKIGADVIFWEGQLYWGL